MTHIGQVISAFGLSIMLCACLSGSTPSEPRHERPGGTPRFYADEDGGAAGQGAQELSCADRWWFAVQLPEGAEREMRLDVYYELCSESGMRPPRTYQECRARCPEDAVRCEWTGTACRMVF